MPDLVVGSTVKLAKKKGKFSDTKFDFSSWTDETYNITAVIPGDTVFYELDRAPTGLARKRYIRSELLLVKGVQKPVAVRARGKQKKPFVAKDV